MAKGPWVSKRQRRQLLDAITQHVGSFIDRIHLSDATELVATAGVALILANADDFVSQLRKNKYALIFKVDPLTRMSLAGRGGLITGGQPDMYESLKNLAGLHGKIDTPQEWLIVFTIAYLIVHNFGMLVQTTGNIVSSISSLGLKLLPVAAVA